VVRADVRHFGLLSTLTMEGLAKNVGRIAPRLSAARGSGRWGSCARGCWRLYGRCSARTPCNPRPYVAQRRFSWTHTERGRTEIAYTGRSGVMSPWRSVGQSVWCRTPRSRAAYERLFRHGWGFTRSRAVGSSKGHVLGSSVSSEGARFPKFCELKLNLELKLKLRNPIESDWDTAGKKDRLCS